MAGHIQGFPRLVYEAPCAVRRLSRRHCCLFKVLARSLGSHVVNLQRVGGKATGLCLERRQGYLRCPPRGGCRRRQNLRPCPLASPAAVRCAPSLPCRLRLQQRCPVAGRRPPRQSVGGALPTVDGSEPVQFCTGHPQPVRGAPQRLQVDRAPEQAPEPPNRLSILEPPNRLSIPEPPNRLSNLDKCHNEHEN